MTFSDAPLLREELLKYGGEEIKVAPFPVIEDDIRAIRKDPTRKMSELTLRYLKGRKIISSEQYSVYRWAHNCPKDRTIITEKNIIEHVNLKLTELYDSV
jgi:hypothetical protein